MRAHSSHLGNLATNSAERAREPTKATEKPPLNITPHLKPLVHQNTIIKLSPPMKQTTHPTAHTPQYNPHPPAPHNYPADHPRKPYPSPDTCNPQPHHTVGHPAARKYQGN